MNLEERISRLERDNRRLKRILCILILLPVGVTACKQDHSGSQTTSVLSPQSLQI
jgi:hypothetical protein